jgi:hypoxanthine phosphoribosyltransferase
MEDSNTKSKTYLTWSDIEMLVHDLCAQIAKSGVQITDIYGLQRGGLIPAVMLSHKLGIPMTINRVSNTTLIVDDICDSGETFRELFKMYPKSKFACLHFKPHTSVFHPTFFTKFHSDDWIVYPWERNDSDAIQDYLK